MGKIFNGSNQAPVFSPIVLVSNQEIKFGSSGMIELRKNSKTGELIESFDILSDKIVISAWEIIIQPTNPLPYETEIYMLMSDGFIISKINGSSFSGFAVNGNEEFKFVTENPIGKSLEGGIVISKENSWYVVISPEKSEMLLTWYEFDKAIQKTEEDTGTSGWYIPDYYEMQFYKKYLNNDELYWTNTEVDINNSYVLNNNANFPVVLSKKYSHLVRTFKKVNINF